MATKTINLRLVAYSDAAGKFDADAPLNGNEDNFYVDDDLTDDVSGPTRLDTPIALSSLGCILAVADGMGGQNAGEVASEIAVNTIADFFRADRITPDIMRDADSRAEYIRRVIVEADRRVKAGAEGHPERFGMGSTIIISWIVDGTLTTGWLGDSRCYRFNTRYGLVPVSRDHTYVQELADKGILSYQDTFSHPQGNIVTRSLGDPESDPQPETASSQLYNGDIILMCSDGLSGVVPDRPLRDIADSINGIMTADYGDLTAMKNHLMEAAERQDWYDNVTVLLAKFTGDLPAAPSARQMAETDPTGSLRPLFDEPATVITPPAADPGAPTAKAAPKAAAKSPAPKSGNRIGRYIGIFLVLLLIAAAVFFALKIFRGSDGEAAFTASEGETPVRPVDTYDGSEAPGIVPAAPSDAAGPDGAPAHADPDGKDSHSTVDAHPTADNDVEIVPVDNPDAHAPADMVDQATSKGVERTWKEQLTERLDQVKISRWKDRIKSLKRQIAKAPYNQKGRFEGLVQALEERIPYAVAVENDIIPRLKGDVKKEAQNAVANFPDWTIDKIKSETERFRQAIPGSND